MSIREEIRKYFEANGEEMWTDHDMHIDEIFSIIENRIDKCKTIEEVKEMLKN